MTTRCIILVLLVCTCNKLHAQAPLPLDSALADTWAVGFVPLAVFKLVDPKLSKDTCFSLILDSLKYPHRATAGNRSTSSICNSAGSLLLYTTYAGEPCNTIDHLVPGWEQVNSPKGHRFKEYAKRIPQLTIILPKGGSQYYVFTTGMSDSLYDKLITMPNWQYEACDVLSYYEVDMAMNEGVGQVTSYNNVIYEAGEPLGLDRLTAVRHANGRDWWLVKPHKTKQQLYTFLVTPYGVSLHDNTIQDTSKLTDRYSRGQATFSADGTQFAMVHNQDSNYTVYLYNFDRCAGLFSNFRQVKVPLRSKLDGLQGVCFSPSGRMLYVSSYQELLQIDLDDSTIDATTLIEKDQPNLFDALALAVNGHVYVGNFHATHTYMSYINKPDLKGLACDFRLDGLASTGTNLLTPPNVPNYRLGRLVGSPCDTLYKAPAPVPQVWALYPNPTQELLNIQVPDSTAQSIAVSLWSSTGQLVAKQTLAVNSEHIASINVGYLSRGVYAVRVGGVGVEFVGRFIKK
jgi:hypothetical protein